MGIFIEKYFKLKKDATKFRVCYNITFLDFLNSKLDK